jgi:hypothetical protein
MDTVTPVNSHEAQQFQQELISQASRAFQILLDTFKQVWNKKTEQQQEKIEQQKDNKPENLKNQFKITIGGKDKDPNQLTWEDYGKLQACSQQDIGDNNLALANIKVVQITQNGKEQPLLETNGQGTVLTNTLKPPSPPNITASQAVNQALNKLDNSPVKDYLVTINQQLTQQLQQQQQILQESQRINQQLTQQLHQNLLLTKESQKINQQQAILLQTYQQLHQQRDKKDPHWWSKAGIQLNKKVNQVKEQVDKVGNNISQSWTTINQWLQERNEQIKQQSTNRQLAVNICYFAKEIMRDFKGETKISGDKYTIEKKSNFYQLKSNEGSVLMQFQDKGVLGIKVLKSNLNPQQQQDIHQLRQFRKDPLFLRNNYQFVSNQPSNVSEKQSQKQLDEKSNQDLHDIFEGLTHIAEKLGNDINETNRGDFNIKTSDGGQEIQITRNSGELVAAKSKAGQIMIPTTSTENDLKNLKYIVNKAVVKTNELIQHKNNELKLSKGR